MINGPDLATLRAALRVVQRDLEPGRRPVEDAWPSDPGGRS